MATTFTLASTVFGDLSSADGTHALYMRGPTPDHRIIPFHPPGTNGNLIIFDGRVGGTIICSGRYIGILATILSAYRTDRLAWTGGSTGGPISIIDDEGTTFQRCVLTSCQRTDPKAMGRGGGKSFFDFVATFDWHGSE